jgi:hypothetical protein
MPPEFWAILAALIVLFGAPAFAPGGVRSPTATRYIFPGVVVLLLLLAELAGHVRFATRRALVAAGAVAAVLLFAIVCNAIVLERNARMWAAAGSRLRAELTAVDLARGHVDPEFRAEDPTVPVAPGQPRSFGLAARGYFATASDFGSPAFTPAELRFQPAPIRETADRVLAPALALHLSPVATKPPTRNPRPRVLATTGAVRPSSPGCRRTLSGGPSPSAQLELPRRGVALVGANQATALTLARFGDSYSVPLEPPSSRVAQLRIPPDADPTPWRLLVRGFTRPIEACGLAHGGA